MEVANKVQVEGKVKAGDSAVGGPPIPTSVRRSSVPDPETTRGKSGDKKSFRFKVEEPMKEKVEEVEVEVKEERIFSREDEPEIRGTIVITIYENHPYDVEFSGKITGNERDLAWRAMMKQYMVWKAKIAKQQEREIKIKADKEKKEEGNARN